MPSLPRGCCRSSNLQMQRWSSDLQVNRAQFCSGNIDDLIMIRECRPKLKNCPQCRTVFQGSYKRYVLDQYTPLSVKICLLLWKIFSKIFNFFPKFSIFFQNFQKNSKFSEIFKFFKISKITIDFEYFPNIFRSIINNHTSWKEAHLSTSSWEPRR